MRTDSRRCAATSCERGYLKRRSRDMLSRKRAFPSRATPLVLYSGRLVHFGVRIRWLPLILILAAGCCAQGSIPQDAPGAHYCGRWHDEVRVVELARGMETARAWPESKPGDEGLIERLLGREEGTDDELLRTVLTELYRRHDPDLASRLEASRDP